MAVDVGDGYYLLAGAGVVVFDDEVDGEVGGVPVLGGDGDGLTGGAKFCGDDGLLFGAVEGGAVYGLIAEVDLFHLDLGACVGIVERGGGGVGPRIAKGGDWWAGRHLARGDGGRGDGFACDAGTGIEEDVEAGGGVEDMGGEEHWLALEGGGDQHAELVVDAARGVAGDLGGGGADVFGAVGELLVGEDVDGGGEGGVGDGGDVDAGDSGLDSAIVGWHALLVGGLRG